MCTNRQGSCSQSPKGKRHCYFGHKSSRRVTVTSLSCLPDAHELWFSVAIVGRSDPNAAWNLGRRP
jgi:hypothetical protein